MLYFLINKLCGIEHMYQYSLDSFVMYFYIAIERSAKSDKVNERVNHLTKCLRLTIYTMVARGLYVRHKLIFLSMLCFSLMKRGNLGEDNLLNEQHFQYLLRGPRRTGDENTLSWLPLASWEAILSLSDIEEFNKLAGDVVEAAPRFREWFNHITPEAEKLPLDWSALDRTPFQKMLVVRALRPDRIATALTDFIRVAVPSGPDFVDSDSALSSKGILENCLVDASATTPIYFILSAGANVMNDLDATAEENGFVSGDTYHQVAMGQGQDVIAMRNLEMAHRQGHWVALNNVHLMPRWLIELEKKLDEFALEGSNKKFRLFLSSDASNAIPIGILNRSIKITSEPPAGLRANVKRAFATLDRATFEDCETKMKSILFGLCHFHAVTIERKQYGPMGYNMMYPFGIGDLKDSASVLFNYMENSSGGKIPWSDLRYIFGEIMYGGHIVNDFDRLMCNSYLEFFLKDELLDETEMYPFNEEEKGVSFTCPPPVSFDKYLEYIDIGLASETPVAFGLHPNAEIDFRTTLSTNILSTILDLQSHDNAGDSVGMTPDEIAAQVCGEISDRIADKQFDTEDIARGLEEQGPYQNVFIQEMDVMNILLTEIRRSLDELKLGFSGDLTMSDAMDNLKKDLFLERVPPPWGKRAWPSLRGLTTWLIDFHQRLAQLEEWQNNPAEIPKVTWVSGLVNPQSFLTAICQVTAQSNKWELDKIVTWTEPSKKMEEKEVERKATEGAYIMGLKLQGCRWDFQNQNLERSKPKEMFCAMPIINVKAIASEKAETGTAYYRCPCYKTEMRGPTFVFCAQLKTKALPNKWILAGCALIMDTVA
jgi:dynein heavy chain